jgi:hypothetical protein
MSLVESEVNSPSSWKINPGKILALVKAAAAKAQNKPVNFIIKVYKRKEVNEKKFGKSEFFYGACGHSMKGFTNHLT